MTTKLPSETGEFWHFPPGERRPAFAQSPLTREQLAAIRVAPAVPTLFAHNGLNQRDAPIDFAAMGKLVNWLIEQGANALVIAGTTGEAATMDHTEQIKLIRWAVRTVKNRVPVIAGIGSNCTNESIILARGALEAGAAAGLLVMPYYNKPPMEGQLAHFQAVAKVGLPIILYSVKGRTGLEINSHVVRVLSEKNEFIGMKIADGDLGRFELCSAITEDSFVLLSGDDNLTLVAARKGWCSGTITVAGMLAIPRLQTAINHVCANSVANIADDEEYFGRLAQIVFHATNPIPIKHILERQLRLPVGFRLPLVQLSPAAQTDIFDRLDRIEAACWSGWTD
jgi:4-hydroxy-tetrahydrodipicolinate synthase